jgi:carbon storage regulator CsrA
MSRWGGGLMLVLSRKRGQAIVIGDDVEITVNDVTVGGQPVRGAKVKLAITAPGQQVLRKEIADDPGGVRGRAPERCT